MKNHSEQKQFQTKLSEDEQLSRLFRQLPSVKLSDNFTEQVLAKTFGAVRQQSQQSQRPVIKYRYASFLRFQHWWQVAASFVLLCTVTGFIYLQHSQSQAKMQQMAQSLSVVAETAEMIATVDESDLTAISMLSELDDDELDGDLWVAMVSN